MSIADIRRSHIIQAADDLDNLDEISAVEYWMYIDEKNKEFPFRQTIALAHQLATGRSIARSFQSNNYYRSYIEKTFGYKTLYRIFPGAAFFSKKDILYFADNVNKPLRGDNVLESIRGKVIDDTIFKPTNSWAKALNIDGFEVMEDKRWQIRGRIAKYSWAQIYRTGDKGRKVFFTVGVDGEARELVYKLDCYFSSSDKKKVLSLAQIEIFNRYVATTNARRQKIDADELSEYNWDTLLEMTRDFILYYIPLYDEVLAAVWSSAVLLPQIQGCLTEQPAPPGISVLQDRVSGKFNSEPDYDGENRRKREIGKAGEKMVKAHEFASLVREGRVDLAENIKMVRDYEGYDLLSFYPDGRKKYIEVKTTPAGRNRPFFWSWNERKFMSEHQGEYCIYRLYNFDEKSNTADFFKIEENIADKILEEPTQYRVHIKKID